MQTDVELIDQVRKGKTQAYALLVGRYERLVRATVRQRALDQHAAEDVVQESFLAAFESLGALRQETKFGSWLLSIARRKAAHAVRRKRRGELAIADMDSVQPDANGRLSERSEQLLELVQKLPDHERVIVALRHFEGHSVKEISQITGRPVGTITKQLSRAHQRLKKWLEREIRR